MCCASDPRTRVVNQSDLVRVHHNNSEFQPSYLVNARPKSCEQRTRSLQFIAVPLPKPKVRRNLHDPRPQGSFRFAVLESTVRCSRVAAMRGCRFHARPCRIAVSGVHSPFNRLRTRVEGKLWEITLPTVRKNLDCCGKPVE